MLRTAILFLLLSIAGLRRLVDSAAQDQISKQSESNHEKSISWWVSAADPEGISGLRHALTTVKTASQYPLLASLKKIYLCCNIFNVTQTRGENPRPQVAKKFTDSYLRSTIESYRREFPTAKIMAHVQASYKPMIIYGAATKSRYTTTATLVAMAKYVGLDGVTVDYEPQNFFHRRHAYVYKEFLDELSVSMQDNGMEVGTVVSAWGILQYYDIYGQSKVDSIGSMSNTYYGNDIEYNRKNVKDMMKSIPSNKLEIGLGLMHINGTVKIPKRVYKWNRKKLRGFLRWLSKQGITQIHVWPGEWRAHKEAELYYLKALAEF